MSSENLCVEFIEDVQKDIVGVRMHKELFFMFYSGNKVMKFFHDGAICARWFNLLCAWVLFTFKKEQGSFFLLNTQRKDYKKDWINKISRKDFVPNDGHRICSKHVTVGRNTYMENMATIVSKTIKPAEVILHNMHIYIYIYIYIHIYIYISEGKMHPNR